MVLQKFIHFPKDKVLGTEGEASLLTLADRVSPWQEVLTQEYLPSWVVRKTSRHLGSQWMLEAPVCESHKVWGEICDFSLSLSKSANLDGYWNLVVQNLECPECVVPS